MSAIAMNRPARSLSQRVAQLKKNWSPNERRRRAQEGQRRMQHLMSLLGLDGNLARQTA